MGNACSYFCSCCLLCIQCVLILCKRTSKNGLVKKLAFDHLMGPNCLLSGALYEFLENIDTLYRRHVERINMI